MSDAPGQLDLPPRDRAIVRWVADFKQMSSSQIHELLFAASASHTPTNRALRRLVASGHLLRIERRIVGGARGGSGQYVFQLGRRGFYLFFDGRFSPWRTVNYHALAIVDTVLALRRLERAGFLSLVGMSTEPNCHVRIGNEDLRPDLYIELAWPGGDRLKLFFEIDMATEGQKQLRDKLMRYWRAYNEADVSVWPIFPRIIWVAVDAERDKELRWLIGSLPPDSQVLFSVCTLATLADLFSR